MASTTIAGASDLPIMFNDWQTIVVRNTFVDLPDTDMLKMVVPRSKSVPSHSSERTDDYASSFGFETLHEARRREYAKRSTDGDLGGDDNSVVEMKSEASTQAPPGLPVSSVASIISEVAGNRATGFLTPLRGLHTNATWNLKDSSEPEEKCAEVANDKTTLMLRNLPDGFTRSQLEQLLDSEGFAKRYNFLYLPASLATNVAFGYAFINMVTPDDAKQMLQHFQNFERWPMPCTKRAVVHMSEALQGLEEQIERYRNSPLMHPVVPDTLRPAIYRDGVRAIFPEPTAPLQAPRMRPSGRRKTPKSSESFDSLQEDP